MVCTEKFGAGGWMGRSWDLIHHVLPLRGRHSCMSVPQFRPLRLEGLEKIQPRSDLLLPHFMPWLNAIARVNPNLISLRVDNLEHPRVVKKRSIKAK